MIYYFYEYLSQYFSAFNVLRYLTFRSMVAFIVTLSFVLVLQPVFIKWVMSKSSGQPIRDDGPESHASKKGTPTMGGLVIICSVLISTILFADLTNAYVWAVLLVTVAYGALGFVDDFKKVRLENTKGVRAKTKLFWQFLIAVAAVLLLQQFASDFSTLVHVPFLKNVSIDLGLMFIPFAATVIVGSSNAVNLTDGLDGLVIGPIMTTAFAYGVFSYVAGNVKIAEYLQIAYISGCGDLSIFAASVVAGGLGFLWFNSFPAQIFMGDVGSLALGGAIGMLAVITKQELLLVVVGGVFVVEALSVIIQVASFKLTGKRVFKMAPIHHHFELLGMAEPKIIVRAWIISIVLALLAIATLKLR